METFYRFDREERIALTLRAREIGEPLMVRWNDLDADAGEQWDLRGAAAAEWLSAASSIADLGCGAMNLEHHLDISQTYVPVDVVRRNDRTLVLDLNKSRDLDRLPEAQACAILGVLEYVYAADALVSALGRAYRQVVVSFNVRHAGQTVGERLAHGWVNHFTYADVVHLFTARGFVRTRERQFEGRRRERLFDFRRADG